MATESAQDSLDKQNQFLAENLASKVNRLKNIAVDMEQESKDSNKYLSGMDDDFDGTTGLLSGSIKRLGGMVQAGKGNRRIMCYLILILVLVFFVSYYLLSWLRQ